MDLKRYRLPIAIVLLLALGLGTFVALDRRDAPDESSSVERVSPTSGIDRGAVTALEITRPGEATTRVEIRDGEFDLVEPFEAKADAAAINQMLDRLVDIEIDAVAATREKHHEALGVSDARAIQVAVFVGDQVVADLRIGETRGRATMLRDAASPNVLSARGSLRHAFDKKVDDLRDKRILTLDEESVTSVTFENESGTFRFDRTSAEADFTPGEGTPSIPSFDPSSVRARVMTLSRLRASGFAPKELSRDDAGLASPRATVRIVTGNETHTLLLGGEAPTGVYAAIEGGELVYVLPSSTAQRFMPKPADLEASAAPPPPPAGEGGVGELPPELLEQLQRQLGER